MSELISCENSKQDLHWQLLASASMLALLTAVIGPTESMASDQTADRPTVWIELGGQFEQIETGQETFVPPFFAVQPSFTSITPGQAQKPLGYGYGAEGKISFEPEGSDWVFTAALRYGRSNGKTDIHQSTTPRPIPIIISGQPNGYYITHKVAKFADTASTRSESHTILDFLAGKDVGMGLFGRDGYAVVNFGVRIAQFHNAMRASVGLDADTGGYKYIGSAIKVPTSDPHPFLGSAQSTRSFHGVGPTVSWDGTLPFAGDPDRGEFTFDWGINAAVLFGRQKASIHHQTAAQSHPSPPTKPYDLINSIYQNAFNHARSQSVIVPNVGGLAGVSLKFPNAKVSLGYRADFFFNAMDGGIDTRKTEGIGFFGPFATVSIGLGG